MCYMCRVCVVLFMLKSAKSMSSKKCRVVGRGGTYTWTYSFSHEQSAVAPHRYLVVGEFRANLLKWAGIVDLADAAVILYASIDEFLQSRGGTEEQRECSPPELDVTGQDFAILAGYGTGNKDKKPSHIAVIALCRHMCDDPSAKQITGLFEDAWNAGAFKFQNRGPRTSVKGAPGLATAGWVYNDYNPNNPPGW